jgi:hypothetical protein
LRENTFNVKPIITTGMKQIMGDGGVGDNFHRFLRGFPRFCAPI